MTLSFAELFDGAPVALLAVNLNGEVLAHNAGLSGWLDPEAEDPERNLRGRNLVEWLSPASRLLYETRIMPRLMETGSVREVVLEAGTRAGGRRSVLVNARLRTVESGERLVFIAVVDAAERIAFEGELVAARRAAETAHERLAVLQEATGRLALAEGVADLGDVLAAAAARATRAAWACVRLADGAQEEGTGLWGSVPLGVTLSGVVVGDAEQLVCRDPGELRERVPDRAGTLLEAGVEAMVVTPVVRPGAPEGRPLGEIHCWFRRGRALDEAELETLRALASQAERVLDHLRLQERLRHRALHDELTGLPNRVLLEQRLGETLEASRRAGSGCAVLFLDLDGFKAINDGLGHAVGDEVLRIVADRLRGTCRAGETVARLGGDEFVVVASGLDRHGADGLARRIWGTLREPLGGAAAGAPLSSSVGVVRWDPSAGGSAPTPNELLREADAAMYAAKHSGKDAVSLREWGPRGVAADPAAG